MQHVKIPQGKTDTIYSVTETLGDPVKQFAPLFLAHGSSITHNRIGRPSASYVNGSKEHIYIDVENPAIYSMVRNFSTAKNEYTNYIYRVHFPAIPFSLIPFHFSSGKNVGLLVVVTVDRKNLPVLVTTVHTCGCYIAVVPTSHLPREAFPDDWEEGPIRIYGESLPPMLDYKEKSDPGILVHLRPDVHRVMDLELIEKENLWTEGVLRKTVLEMARMEELERIPIDGSTTSFYHKDGPLSGYVKGSIKIWESILFGPLSLDLFVGTDKAYADPSVYGNPFYTSLKPWNRESSNMWDFRKFLEFLGWRL